jgi:hypothetical protein
MATREPTRTDDNWNRFTIDEVYNGWLVKVSTVVQGNDRTINRFVFPSAELLLDWLKEELTNA